MIQKGSENMVLKKPRRRRKTERKKTAGLR